MRAVFTGPQSRALRVLHQGPRRKAHFDGRTALSLIARGLAVCEDEVLRLTDQGRRHADREVADWRVQAQPMMRLDAIPAPADGMSELCCSGWEEAVKAGVLQVDSNGKAYIRHERRAWYISRCPWCPEVSE